MINRNYEAVDRESISNFIKWAADRIEREFLENEKVARESGGLDFTDSPKNLRGKRFTIQEKLKIIKSIITMNEDGRTIKYGCSKNGIHPCTFGRWKTLLQKKGLL